MHTMKQRKQSLKQIYLDHAATTPVDPRVLNSMSPFWSENFANPSALYKSGRLAKQAIENSRTQIAKVLNCKNPEITFTAGGTESNNLAILGVAKNFVSKNKKTGHIISTTIEHHSVLHVLDALKSEGWKISFAKVNAEGFVNPDEIKKLVRKDTALISIMYANNEIGTIQPIVEIGKWLTGLNKARFKNALPKILFHTDACQAAGALSLDTAELRVDLLTLNGSKIYGPKQTGILFARSGLKLEPIMYGGGQENNLRSGTENVPGVVGLGVALELAQQSSTKENIRLQTLQHYFVDRLSKKVKGVHLNGPSLAFKKARNFKQNVLNRLPNNINFSFNNIEGETLMLYLDSRGISVSTGSACATTSLDPSHVLVAIGASKEAAYGAVRFTMGKKTTKESLEYVIDTLVEIVPMLRKVNR